MVKGGMYGERGMCGRGVYRGRGACMVGVGHMWQGRRAWWWVGGGACVAGETATAADGTHATGMHSC